MNHASRFHKYLLLPMAVLLMFAVLGSDCKKQEPKSDGGFETGSMTGNDGKVYKTVKIGNQVWMAENLRETKYRNGDTIPEVTDDVEWGGLTTSARCVYDNSESNADIYGYLYNWFAVADGRNIAPSGWRVPTDADWTTLVNYLGGGYRAEGSKMKEAGTWHWTLPNREATNESGFTALPGGYRANGNGYFNYLGNIAHFWSATEYNTNDAWDRVLYYDHSGVDRNYDNKRNGFSVRLIRD